MRKILTILTVVMFMMCCAVNAAADVIFEPQDSFYESHRDQCEYHDRAYTATGPNGDVKIYESPESDSLRDTVPNGEELYISHIYRDEAGIAWGYAERWGSGESGWVPMDYLVLIYDEISFMEDHGDVITEEEGVLSAELAGQTGYLWQYPGSGEYFEFTVNPDYLPGYQMIYVDAAGTRWGRVGYFMGMQGWLNLDDPTADYETLFPNGTGETQPAAEEPAAEPVEEIAPRTPQNRTVVIVLTAAAVACVVAVTAALLAALRRKGRKE